MIGRFLDWIATRWIKIEAIVFDSDPSEVHNWEDDE